MPRLKAPEVNEAAVEAFMETYTQIDAMLQAFELKNEDMLFGDAPEDIHWGHVGSAQACLAKLKEAMDYLK